MKRRGLAGRRRRRRGSGARTSRPLRTPEVRSLSLPPLLGAAASRPLRCNPRCQNGRESAASSVRLRQRTNERRWPRPTRAGASEISVRARSPPRRLAGSPWRPFRGWGVVVDIGQRGAVAGEGGKRRAQPFPPSISQFFARLDRGLLRARLLYDALHSGSLVWSGFRCIHQERHGQERGGSFAAPSLFIGPRKWKLIVEDERSFLSAVPMDLWKPLPFALAKSLPFNPGLFAPITRSGSS